MQALKGSIVASGGGHQRVRCTDYQQGVGFARYRFLGGNVNGDDSLTDIEVRDDKRPFVGVQSLYLFAIRCKNVKLNGGVNIIRYWCNGQRFHFIAQVYRVILLCWAEVQKFLPRA